MVKQILTSSGIPFRRARYPSPPAGTYIVYMDDITTDGPDGLNWLYTHDITLEVYEPKPDDAAEATIEAALNAAGIAWTKQERYWLQSEQRYQVVYEFSYTEKRSE